MDTTEDTTTDETTTDETTTDETTDDSSDTTTDDSSDTDTDTDSETIITPHYSYVGSNGLKKLTYNVTYGHDWNNLESFDF
jgi:hypothetical protein